LLLRIGVMRVVDGRAAIAAHVRSDGAEAQAADAAQHVPPAQGEFGPAVDEDRQRAVLRPGREVEDPMLPARRRVISTNSDRAGFSSLNMERRGGRGAGALA